MMFLTLLAGLVFLILGAEALVRGASRLAAALGVSPLVIGLTVVAFGTSSPELAVSLKAALAGNPEIALGNVVGSNIFNVLFILGISALVTPLVVSQKLVRFDVPLMIGVSGLVLVLGLDGKLGRGDGMLLFGILVVYLLVLFRKAPRNEGVPAVEPRKMKPTTWMGNAVLILTGLAFLILGSRWLVEGAMAVARLLGVSDLIIALTIVAAGTSLPEVVTSVLASIRGERDIAVGNVVGSNLFNILGVLGVSAFAAPSGIAVAPSVLRFDFPVMIVVAFACLPIFFTGGRISRGEGGLLLGYYAAYSLYLILAASQHEALPRFSAVLVYFAVPLTLVTLGVLAAREGRRRKESSLPG